MQPCLPCAKPAAAPCPAATALLLASASPASVAMASALASATVPAPAATAVDTLFARVPPVLRAVLVDVAVPPSDAMDVATAGRWGAVARCLIREGTGTVADPCAGLLLAAPSPAVAVDAARLREPLSWRRRTPAWSAREEVGTHVADSSGSGARHGMAQLGFTSVCLEYP